MEIVPTFEEIGEVEADGDALVSKLVISFETDVSVLKDRCVTEEI